MSGVDIAPAIPVLEKLIESEDGAIRLNATRAADAAAGIARSIPYRPDWVAALG